MSTFPRRFRTWKVETLSIELYRKPHRNKSGQEAQSLHKFELNVQP